MLTTIATLKADANIPAINHLIPYAETLGIESFFENGKLITVLRFREANIGNTVLRAIHGGVVGALLEHAAIVHLIHEVDITAVPKIINVSVDYLRPTLAVDTFAQGVVIKQGKRVANVRVQAWQDGPDRPVAAAHAHFLLV